MDDEEHKELKDLQEVAESWLCVVTVILVMQVALITFLLSSMKDDDLSFIAIAYFGIATVAPMTWSVACFLATRDYRFSRFPRYKILNIAVIFACASVVTSSIGAGYGAFLLTGSLILAVTIAVVLTGSVCAFYNGYYKWVHNSGK